MGAKKSDLNNLDRISNIETINFNLNGSKIILIEQSADNLKPKNGQTITLYNKDQIDNTWKSVEGCHNDNPFSVTKKTKETCKNVGDTTNYKWTNIYYKTFKITKVDSNRTITLDNALPFDLDKNSQIQIEDKFVKIEETNFGKANQNKIFVKNTFKLLIGDSIRIDNKDFKINDINFNTVTLDSNLERNLSTNKFDITSSTTGNLSVTEIFNKNELISCKLNGSNTNFIDCSSFF